MMYLLSELTGLFLVMIKSYHNELAFSQKDNCLNVAH